MAVAAVALYTAIIVFVWWSQDSIVFEGTRGYTDLPENHGLQREDINLEVEPGAMVRGWFVHAVGPPHATILYLHGNGGNVSTYLGMIRQFAEAGFDSFSIDYEGYGESTGHASEASAYRDANAAWLWLTDNRGVNPRHLAIWGYSLGGGVATQLAEVHTPGAVVLQSTFTSIPDVGAERLYWLPARPLVHTFFNNLDRMPKIHAPIFVAHGRADRVIPFEMGQHLFAAANPPKIFGELKGGHGDGLTAPLSIWNDVLKFLEQSGVVD
jgi:pimeloyl-ACP methyl ester carboxylesterase